MDVSDIAKLIVAVVVLVVLSWGVMTLLGEGGGGLMGGIRDLLRFGR